MGRHCLAGGRDEHRERIARPARTDTRPGLFQSAHEQHLRELLFLESKRAIAELRAHPLFMMLAQIENQNSSARHRDARRLGDGPRRIRRVVQRLRQQRHIHRLIVDRKFLQLAPPPGDVGRAAAPAERAGAGEDRFRSIDADHRRGPARGLDREIPFAAAEVRDAQRRQQQAQRARPGGPAASRHQLPAVAAVDRVPLEVLLAEPQHLLQPGPIRLHGRVVRGPVELIPERGPQRVQPVLRGVRQPVIGESGVFLFDDEPGLLQQLEVPRHARLREAEDAGQLRDIEPFLPEHPQQPEPGLVAEQTVDR